MRIFFKTLLAIICILASTQVYYANSHQYNLSFNDELDIVEVNIKLASTENSLRARNSSEHFFVKPATECDTGQLLVYKNKRLLLRPDVRCVTYSMRLQQIQKIQQSRHINPQANTVITQANEWLFLPNIKVDKKIIAQVQYSSDYNLSVPWEVNKFSKNEFFIRDSPNSGNGLIVIGEFEVEKIQHHGTELRVAYLPGKPIDKSMIKHWLIATVNNVTLAYGRFPHPNPQVIISPSAKSWSRQDSPVPFGRVVRDHGESVQFFIDQRQSLNDFKKDWTATHEFSHLLLPYISWKNRWLSEGFASYYQNVLMARAGVYSEKLAWQKLYDGFMRGKKSAPELSPNSAAREGWGSNMKVYWSGAALFLAADVELRLQSANNKSLDTTLDKLQKCCLPSGQSWSGTQLMRKLDSLSDSKVFSHLYTQYANEASFVDFQKYFTQLGISIQNGKVKLDDDPEHMRLRQNIMQRKL